MVTTSKKILGPDGLPAVLSTPAREFAGPTMMGVRATLHEAVATGMTPDRLAAVLKRATTGEIRDYLTLAEEMEERYLHYASQVQTRRLAIEGVDISLEVPEGVPTKIEDAVRALVEDTRLLEAAGALTDGIAKGFSIVEPVWDYADGLMRPVEYRWRDPRFFQFDRIGMTELRLASDTNMDGEPLPTTAFLRHLPRSKAGIPIRRGFARAAAWAWMLQGFALKDWAAFAEVYGMPMRVGKYHAGASGDDKRTLLRAVASIANDAAAIIPQGMEIEFHGVEGSKGEAVFGSLLEYLDRNISKLVVGQTMTADDGSSMAQAKVHNEVRLDILRADCRQLAHTLNRDLVQLFVAVNFGPQEKYPTLVMPVAEPEDVEALTKAVGVLVPLGLKVSQREMREKLGLSEPDDKDELLAPQRPPEVDTGDGERPALKSTENRLRQRALNRATGRADLLATSAHSCRCAACTGTARLAADAVDLPPPRLDVEVELEALVEEALSDWHEMTDPILAPLLAAVEKANSFDELLALLPAAAKGMDGRRLAEQLAKLSAIARGLGDVSD